MRFRGRSARVILCAALLPLVALSCLDGAYPIANPNDPLFQLEMQVIGGVDTVRTAGQVVLFQLVTTPVVAGYKVDWTSSQPAWIGSRGDGLYITGDLPTVPVGVQITARLGNQEAIRAVVIMPAAP